MFSKFIREDAITNELSLIEPNTSSADVSKHNPSTVIVDGVDIYRIAEFKEDFIPQTISMEEGVNTTRILSTTLSTLALDDLSFWTEYINGTSTPQETYGRIDTGNKFFYGGDVGANDRSVYVETYIDSPIEREPLIKEFRKADANSQQWDVYVFLNGREIGSLPEGTDTALLPWKFNEGLNHIALTINIPASSDAYPSPYLGTLDLMVGDDPSTFGTVKLATWSYIDLFKMSYNETGQPKTFTISDNEIISRRKPTTNFRLRYAKSTDRGPTSIRLRADLERSSDNDSVSSIIDSYSVRFSYGDKN